MLSESASCAVLAVKDMAKAKKFYEDKLGLKSSKGQDPGGIMYDTGKGTGIFVYESSFAGTNKATAAAWNVEDIKKVVEELKGNGVSFEHYDMPQAKREGDIHILGDLKAAWFTDPDGNILNLVEGM